MGNIGADSEVFNLLYFSEYRRFHWFERYAGLGLSSANDGGSTAIRNRIARHGGQHV